MSSSNTDAAAGPNPAVTMMTKAQFTENVVKPWHSLNQDLAEINPKVQKLRKEKRKLEDDMLDWLVANNEGKGLRVAGHEVKVTQVKKKAKIDETYLVSEVRRIQSLDETEAHNYVARLLSNRAENQKTKLSVKKCDPSSKK